MLIALDYDGTYTRCKELWNAFIDAATFEGHNVICITLRYPEEEIKNMPCKVYYTSRKSKAAYAQINNLVVDIWIDDSPFTILQGTS